MDLLIHKPSFESRTDLRLPPVDEVLIESFQKEHRSLIKQFRGLSINLFGYKGYDHQAELVYRFSSAPRWIRESAFEEGMSRLSVNPPPCRSVPLRLRMDCKRYHSVISSGGNVFIFASEFASFDDIAETVRKVCSPGQDFDKLTEQTPTIPVASFSRRAFRQRSLEFIQGGNLQNPLEVDLESRVRLFAKPGFVAAILGRQREAYVVLNPNFMTEHGSLSNSNAPGLDLSQLWKELGPELWQVHSYSMNSTTGYGCPYSIHSDSSSHIERHLPIMSFNCEFTSSLFLRITPWYSIAAIPQGFVVAVRDDAPDVPSLIRDLTEFRDCFHSVDLEPIQNGSVFQKSHPVRGSTDLFIAPGAFVVGGMYPEERSCFGDDQLEAACRSQIDEIRSRLCE